MSLFEIEETGIDGLVVINTLTRKDDRGHFVKTFDDETFKKFGVPTEFAQIDQSKSKKGVLRGLHFLNKYPQGKLVNVPYGRIFDVGVDLREKSPTYGKWYGLELSDENNKMFYIPPGFAHGFLSLKDDSIILYHCTTKYYPDSDCGIKWDDKDINIDWPLNQVDELTISEKDKNWKTLNETNFSFEKL